VDVKEHKESFEAIYRNRQLDVSHLKFPLAEIDKFEWHRGPWGNEYYSYYYRRFTYHILNRLDVKEGHKILVVGCGAGLEEKNIDTLYRNVELWSIDISQEMIKKAINNQSPSHFAVSLAEALPFRDNSFDRVISREVIEHVMVPQKMISEISRVLKPKGIAVITTENGESFSPINFYAIHISSLLAKLLRCPVLKPEFKDEAPKLSEMKSYTRNAGLELVEFFWDGALYKSLIHLRSFVKFKVSAWVHWFSCLENNRTLAYWFCDQVKYILRKPEMQESALSNGAETNYSCILCNGPLRRLPDDECECENCGQRYSIINGIPNLVRSNNEQYKNNVQEISSGRRWRRMAFRVIDNVLIRVYILIYFLFAFLCTLFVKKNRKRYSHILDADDTLLQHQIKR
jgi:ubiquinone/menaquinone biosynthesis C-methylase UbiE/uncharacterized protein YbaR (Trm112 family)